jgi:glutamate/tyrosine decarboxylase-like PLP-dependent enzyme
MPVGSGRIKAGEGSLIGNAGEYYVVAELLKRGVVAALAPRNTPAFDVLATKGSQTVRIRVKTKSDEYSDWQWVVKKDGTIFRALSDHSDFTVLVNLAMDNRGLRFYVVPTTTIDQWLRGDFDEWLRTPGKHGRAHDPTNTKRHLTEEKHAKDLARYLDTWDSLWNLAQS